MCSDLKNNWNKEKIIKKLLWSVMSETHTHTHTEREREREKDVFNKGTHAFHEPHHSQSHQKHYYHWREENVAYDTQALSFLYSFVSKYRNTKRVTIRNFVR
jgi:hypothetical protein